MSMIEFSHGKRGVRVGKIRRLDDGTQTFVEYEVAVQLEGGTEKSYTEGDNRMVVATDTVRNNCYVAAKTCDMLTPEQYAIHVSRHFLQEYPFVTKTRVTVVAKPWTRITQHGRPHRHGFQLGSSGDHVAYAESVRKQHSFSSNVVSSIENLTVLKTTQSGWENFYRDKYTTLPDTNDRILATKISCQWEYVAFENIDYAAVHQRVLGVIFEEFYGDPVKGKYSPGVQRTQYLMAEGILSACPEVSSVKLVLPNIHFLPCNLPSLTKNNMPFQGDVFIPTDEPQGQIECQLVRPKAKL